MTNFFSPTHKRALLFCFVCLSLIFGGTKLLDFNASTPHQFLLPDGWGQKSERKSPPKQVYINSADSAAWEALPCIGKAFSRRIVKYRDILGGFDSIPQLRQVYGLTDSTYQCILPYLVWDQIPAELLAKRKNKNFPQYGQKNRTIPVLDLNEAGAEEFALLPGIGEVLSQRIVNYRNAKKGFGSVEEISKVYGISPETYERILPYLRLENPSKPAAPVKNDFQAEKPAENIAITKLKTGETLDLNTASLEELLKVPGIGQLSAQKIVDSRSHIGGFASVEHLALVGGIQAENFQKMKPFLKVSPIGKQNLNKISAYALQKYPSLNSASANALVNFRKLNGYFQSWEDLKKVEGLSGQQTEVLKQYFELK